MSLKKYLDQFTKMQLIEQILELQKKYKDVKTYYEFTLNLTSPAQADKVKKAIHKLFNPSSMSDPKLREARREVSLFRKLSPPEDSVADVMLHYVECGVEFTNNYGDINEPFYNSIASMFYDACEYIQKNELQNLFKERCRKIMYATDGIGWGFHDELSQYFYDFFGS